VDQAGSFCPVRLHLHKISTDSAAGWHMGMSDCGDALRRMTLRSRYRTALPWSWARTMWGQADCMP